MWYGNAFPVETDDPDTWLGPDPPGGGEQILPAPDPTSRVSIQSRDSNRLTCQSGENDVSGVLMFTR